MIAESLIKEAGVFGNVLLKFAYLVVFALFFVMGIFFMLTPIPLGFIFLVFSMSFLFLVFPSFKQPIVSFLEKEHVPLIKTLEHNRFFFGN